MTKIEYGKCEKLMNKAIDLAMWSESAWEKADVFLKEGQEVDAEVERRKADQYYGEAIGINQVLATLNFKHEKMKELENLI